jgi:PAS domain S-box-containing protein
MAKILAIDDNQHNLTVLSRVLEKLIPDCAVVTAHSGAGGIEKAIGEFPDAILLDVIMPVMDGYEVCRRLKSDEKTKHIPVVMLTGMETDSESRVKGLEIGADAFLTKPIEEVELVAQVNAMLRIKRAEGLLRKERDLLEDIVQERTKALRESEESYRTLTESLPGIVYRLFIRENHRIYFFNSMVSSMTGYKLEELKSGQVSSINPFIIAEDRANVVAAVRTACMEDRPFEVEYRFQHRDGSIRHFCERGRPICGTDGKPLYIDGVIFDTTEHKQAQKEKEKLQAKMAEELERGLEERSKELAQTQAQLFQTSKLSTLGEMSTGLAHEMNQPLAGISLTTKTLRKLMDKGALTDEEVDSGLRDIEGSVKRMSKIIQHIRTFARQDTLEFVEVDVNETIDSALSLLGEQLRLCEIGVVRRFSPALPKIEGEPYQLEEVWMNLIANARDALDEKQRQISDGKLQIENYEKRLHISATPSQESEVPSVEVRITDNGIGLTKEQQERLFDPFFTTKEVGKGTGLGMSISHGIIQSHKGKIEVESKEGEGTTVTVILRI